MEKIKLFYFLSRLKSKSHDRKYQNELKILFYEFNVLASRGSRLYIMIMYTVKP